MMHRISLYSPSTWDMGTPLRPQPFPVPLLVTHTVGKRMVCILLECFLVQNCYRPQTKFAKVMFLQVSVILSRGGMHGCSGGCAWLLGGHAWLLGGACVVAWGVHGCSRGHAWLLGGHAWLLQGVCMVALGGCVVVGGMHGSSGGGVCMVFSMRYGQ